MKLTYIAAAVAAWFLMKPKATAALNSPGAGASGTGTPDAPGTVPAVPAPVDTAPGGPYHVSGITADEVKGPAIDLGTARLSTLKGMMASFGILEPVKLAYCGVSVTQQNGRKVTLNIVQRGGGQGKDTVKTFNNPFPGVARLVLQHPAVTPSASVSFGPVQAGYSDGKLNVSLGG